MPIATPALSTVLDEAVKDYVASNPTSKAINDAASGSLPGGPRLSSPCLVTRTEKSQAQPVM